ncbi:MAG: hypothetical protein JXQ90_09245 [Cyclobacteriaceae bacterium]
MTKLEVSWLTDGLMDFEYKKYVLLAYLKDIKKEFKWTRLYPFLSELIFHFNNLKQLKENTDQMSEQFPKELTGIDKDQLRLNYRKIIEDSETMSLLEELVTYALTQMETVIREGTEIFDFVQDNVSLDPVGLTPLYNKEGYMMLTYDQSKNVSVYRYKVSMLSHANDRYRSISTTLVGNEHKSIAQPFEGIKRKLTKTYTDLPNPASYAVVSKLKFPLPETLLPVAKRLLIRNIDID